MKRIVLLTLTLLFSIPVFAQEKEEHPERPHSFIGFAFGPAFPSGLYSSTGNSEQDGWATTGLNFSMGAGYYFSNWGIGLSADYYNNGFRLFHDNPYVYSVSAIENLYRVKEIAAGPLYGIRATDRITLDFKLFINALLDVKMPTFVYVDSTTAYRQVGSGWGYGLKLGVNARFALSRRFAFRAKADYNFNAADMKVIFTLPSGAGDQEKDEYVIPLNVLNLGIGFDYMFR